MSNIDNYNLSYLAFLEVVKEFRGFLTGLPKNSLETDIVNFSQNFKDTEDVFNNLETNGDESLEILKNEIIPAVFDRTVGGYFSTDIVNKNVKLNKGLDYPVNMGKYIHFVGISGGISSGDGKNTNQFVSTVPEIGKNNNGGKDATIDSTLKHLNIDGKEFIETNDKNEGTGESTTDYLSGVKLLSEASIINSEGVNSAIDRNKYKSPQINSFVFRSSKISILNKNANHLPVFFNAIPPIELSKCSPYLNLTMLTRPLPGRRKTNLVETLRYTGNDISINTNNKKETSVNYNNYKPSGRVPAEIIDAYDFNYMDIFTSPQVMSNADINKSGATFGDFLNNSDDPILEPIMPLLTLKAASISISGKGYGMMSSKKANLTLVLHDRSRLSEIGPLVASDQIGSTRFIIEYGWNHPQGHFENNDNSIAKYLNALKDVCLFTVTSSSYSFSKGGEVDIQLTLHASGYRQADAVHIGAGPVVPVNVFYELIDIVSEKLIAEEKLNANGESEKFKEVRSKLQTVANNSHSVYSNVSWETYKRLAKSLKGENADREELKLEIRNFLYSNADIRKRGVSSNNTLIDSKKRSMQEYAIKKLEYLKSDSFIDPYLTSYITEFNENIIAVEGATYDQVYQNYVNEVFAGSSIATMDREKYGKIVTLGSVISMFIAYPIASICRVDEVQLIFNPINHQGGGARKYTTANFPISIKKLEKIIYDAIKKNMSLTTTNFLNLLIREIVEDRSSLAYGVTSQYEEIERIESERFTDPVSIIIYVLSTIADGNSLPGFDPSNNVNDDGLLQIAIYFSDSNVVNTIGKVDEFVNDNKGKAIKDVLQNIYDSAQLGLTAGDQNQTLIGRCSQLYNNYFDEQNGGKIQSIRDIIESSVADIYPFDKTNLPGSEFVMPSIQLNYETFPVSPGIKTAEEIQKDDKSVLLKELNIINRSIENSSNGIDYEKSLLRISIYDEEAVSSPEAFTLLSSKIAGDENNVDPKLGKRVENMSRVQIKNLVKRNYPTINYGASSATINKISFNANTSGAYNNVLAVEGYANTLTANVNSLSQEDAFSPIQMFPATVQLECAGNPMIGMGNQVYIDFFTNTTLDNIYIVKNVQHSINNGVFTSNIELVPVNQGSYKDFRNRLLKITNKLKQNND